MSPSSYEPELGHSNRHIDTLKGFTQSLVNFTPLLINGSSMFAERLELYTKTLVALEPIDKKAQKAGAEIDQIIDSAMALGMDNIPVVEVPTMNSRAGLYVYLNSLVGMPVYIDVAMLTKSQLAGRPMVDDNQLLNFLHNRYQVRIMFISFASQAYIHGRAISRRRVLTSLSRPLTFSRMQFSVLNILRQHSSCARS